MMPRATQLDSSTDQLVARDHWAYSASGLLQAGHVDNYAHRIGWRAAAGRSRHREGSSEVSRGNGPPKARLATWTTKEWTFLNLRRCQGFAGAASVPKERHGVYSLRGLSISAAPLFSPL